MNTLKGTEKQIAWANKIRDNVFEVENRYLASTKEFRAQYENNPEETAIYDRKIRKINERLTRYENIEQAETWINYFSKMSTLIDPATDLNILTGCEMKFFNK